MFIKSITLNSSEVIWHGNAISGTADFYDEATIHFDRITPHQKKNLLRLYREGLDCYVTRSVKYDIVNKYSNDFTPDIKVTKVIYHNPATIVFWSDGTKTVVKCDKNDTYDPEKGFYIACAKKLFGNNYAAVGRINKALEMAEDKNE